MTLVSERVNDMNETKFEGVIFDFNGVLMWDNHLHEEAWRYLSARMRGTEMTIEEMHAAVHGRTNRDIFEYLLERPLSDSELRPLMEEKEAIYRQLALDNLDTYYLAPGAVDLLDFLADKGIKRAIATSSPRVNVDFFIEHLHLLRWFTPETIIYDHGRYPGKPAPDIYLEAAEQLGGPPEWFVVVEDATAGIQAAHAAGAGAIIAVGPADFHDRLAALPGVTMVVEDMTGFPRSLLLAPAAETFRL